MGFKFNPLEGSGLVPAGGGDGANTSLSNLSSPTAVNQDIIFDKSTPIVKTKDDSLASTQPLTVQTGDASGSGNNSGNISIYSGNNDTDGTTGSVSITTGIGPTGVVSGNITINTGNTAGATNTGSVTLSSGSTEASSGDVYLQSGYGTQISGQVVLSSGDALNSGPVSIYSGDGLGEASVSSNVQAWTGDSDGDSGSIIVSTGSSTSGASGNITLSCGDAATIDGSIRLNAICVKLPIGTSNPSTSDYPDGSCYYNTSTNKLMVLNGGTWRGITLTV